MDEMKKKLQAELVSLAHGILSLKKKNNVRALKEISREVYEKLSVLAAVDKFVDETPQNSKTKETLVNEVFSKPAVDVDFVEPIVTSEKIQEANKELQEAFNLINEIEEEEELVVQETTEIDQLIEKEIEEVTPPVIEDKEFTNAKAELDFIDELSGAKKIDLELENAVPIDVAVNLFENAVRVDDKKTLNDVIHKQKNLQIDLNDRIAFVKNLFGGSQEDFNRVLSQLNTMGSEKEAKSFLKMVKKEYDWGDKEAYEERLYTLIEKKYN